MRFKIEHTTRYHFSGPVFLEPHIIRLQPRNGPAQRLISFDIEVTPKPMRLTPALDGEGNSVALAWFDGLTDGLTFRTACEVETLRENPFDFLFLDAAQERLPFSYSPSDQLHPGLFETAQTPSEAVDALIRETARESGDQTVPFLIALTNRIQDSVKVEVRDEGEPMTPSQTLARGIGACRDLSVLFVECCRRRGMAARFVSGYQQGSEDADVAHLHAWAEVYLPGGGWRAFDPTLGLSVADRHVSLASSASSSGAAPVSGSFRGTGVSSSMEAHLNVETS